MIPSPKRASPAETSDLLSALRASTHTAHEALHRHPRLRDLTGPEVTRAYYARALAGFYGFYWELENAYGESGAPELADFPAGPVIERLEYDLRRQNCGPDRLPRRPATEHFTPAMITAYLYLREGANLGGKVIARNLEQRLGMRPDDECRFFWSDGAATGARWRFFMDSLIRNRADPAQCAACAAGLFNALSDWLDHWPDA